MSREFASTFVTETCYDPSPPSLPTLSRGSFGMSEVTAYTKRVMCLSLFSGSEGQAGDDCARRR